MKYSALTLAIFMIVAPATSSAGADVSAPGIPAAALRFERIPLGNVVRVLSARFATPVTIVANARAPITGDFSAMDLRHALGAASEQAGLVVVPLGPGASGGFALQPPAPGGSREELLKKRAALIEQADRLEH